MNNYNNLDTSKLNYIIYCRKSTEDEDRQVQSLDTQLRELEQHAHKNGLNIVKVISESKSAFKVGREGFNDMTNLFRSGKANAILVVRANRISRNPIDAGYIISLMDEKKLLYIRTPNSTCYTSSSTDKMMIALELIFSKKDSDDKGDMVKEGQTTKALKGYPHGVAALGFSNDRSEEKGNRKWAVDELRLKKIKTLLDMFLIGTYSAGKLHQYAVEELKLTTVPRKRSGGVPIAPSRIYEILADPIYAGFFFYGGKRYELAKELPRLITEEQHERIKIILSKKHIPKIKEHKTTYSGFIASDEGDFIGQDVKYQLICDCKKKFSYMSKTHCPSCGAEISQLENPKYLEYILYYNVRKKKAKQEYKIVPEGKVTEKIVNFVDDSLTFSPELAAWAKKHIGELREKELNDLIFKKRIAEEAKQDFERKKAGIRANLRDGITTEEEYRTDLAALEKQYAPSDTEDKADWYSRMTEILDLTQCMRDVLMNGTVQQKRNILSKLGSNLTWNDAELNIHHDIAIEKFVEGIKRAKAINPEFEPKNCVVYTALNEETEIFSSVSSTLLRG
jgi:DNA invertase Pin-like site-specific DNA recombinase